MSDILKLLGAARQRADVAEAQNRIMRAALETVLENRNYTDRIILTVRTALNRVDDLEKD